MHLDEEVGARVLHAQAVVQAHHGGLDEVGGAPLDDRVEGEALAQLPQVAVARAHLGDQAAAPEDGGHEAVLLGARDALAHEALQARVALLVRPDEGPRLALRDAEGARETERALAVDDAEVDRLRHAPLVGRHLCQGHAEDLRRHVRVDVEPVVERARQLLVLAEVREHAQLDLRVVGADEERARRGDERPADLAARLRAHGDVLDVRL